MSSRWSYGPQGLRERPAKRWSEVELLPRWRDLQPLLIRSAGVVGIVATIMAVVSSDALRVGGEPSAPGRNDRSQGLEAADAPVAPVIAAVSEGQVEAAPVIAEAVPALPAPSEAIETQSLAPELAAFDESAFEAAAAQETASETVAAQEIAPEAVSAEAVPPLAPETSALWTGEALDPAASAATPLTTASVSAPAAIPRAPAEALAFEEAPPVANPTAIAADDMPAEASAVALLQADASRQPAGSEATGVWPDGAAACPRDWMAPAEIESSVAAASECAPTGEMIASVATDHPALQEAAEQLAETLAALAPRIPQPRPDIVPVIKPTRVARRSNDWPDAPPPDCAAGKRAKWRFVDRNSGTKEWYCR